MGHTIVADEALEGEGLDVTRFSPIDKLEEFAA